jgi:hypothetical protein
MYQYGMEMLMTYGNSKQRETFFAGKLLLAHGSSSQFNKPRNSKKWFSNPGNGQG